ncbi:LAMI_0C02520g1_1 [Lachancea mirantina]|uniref:Signal recognition particle subunit SRP68 n=1 Tax=Lachancea mirantina TaxID=1230905 RepID=A0A1G4J1I4_9SACH|nr:LAMI_0C02520g1_1 [Lachancea mirantina]
MEYYSPLGATYGLRADQFLETSADFDKYHAKLNRKLQNLRRRCNLTTRDTKRYSSKEKLSKFTSDEYDTKNKLLGTILLLHCERDLALVECLRLRARQRGALKRNERKVIGARLKKICNTSAKLLEVTQNETAWETRTEYLIIDKLCQVQLLADQTLSRLSSEPEKSMKIVQGLTLVFAALWHLQAEQKLDSKLVDAVIAQFEYLLKQHASANLYTHRELRAFVNSNLQHCMKDPLAQIIAEHGYKISDTNAPAYGEEKKLKSIQWRTFTAELRNPRVAEVVAEAQEQFPRDLSEFSDKIAKWQTALDYQQSLLQIEGESDYAAADEDDQIVLSFIRYSLLFTQVERDDVLFCKLWNQWCTAKNSLSVRLTKYREIERLVSNVCTYLQDIMDLPGVYSDDELMHSLNLATLYYKLHLAAGCLAPLFQSHQRYSESLALYVDSARKLEDATGKGMLQEGLPGDIITNDKLLLLQELITSGWKGVLALAEYEKSIATDSNNKNCRCLVEKLGKSIGPKDANTTKLFPLNPVVRPVGVKPTLFDLAFNYITYEENEQEPLHESEFTSQNAEAVTDVNTPSKKRGLFGLFGR